MKTKQTFKLAASAITLAVIAAGTGHLSATPDWPHFFSGVRSISPPVLPYGYQKATEEEKAAIAEAVRYLLFNDAFFCYTTSVHGIEDFNLNDLKHYPFAKQLPEPFRTSFFRLTNSIQHVKRMQPTHWQDGLLEIDWLWSNWAIVDAICREEFGFSLTTQCFLLNGRSDRLEFDDSPTLEGEMEKDWKNHYRENSALADRRARVFLERILGPNNYQGNATPELRKTIMEWYQADFLNRITQSNPEKTPSIAPPATLPPDLLELIKAAGNKDADPYRQLNVEESKLALRLIELVGITNSEYSDMLARLMENAINTRTGIRSDKVNRYGREIKDYLKNPLYHQAKAQLLAEWQNDGFPSMPIPYSIGPSPFSRVNGEPEEEE